ncbi:MAG: hypothetical protein QXD61_10565 [Candidatus Caldarchaeum sp.]
MRLLIPGLIALALVYGVQLIYGGKLFEGILLMVVGLVGGLYAEYLVAKLDERLCDECGRLMKPVQSIYYCQHCRRFQEKPRRV